MKRSGRTSRARSGGWMSQAVRAGRGRGGRAGYTRTRKMQKMRAKKHKKRGFEADFLIKSGQNRRVLYAIYDFHAVVYTIIIRNVDDF